MKQRNLTKRTWRYKIRAIRIIGDIAYIPLTRGMEAIIDSCDAHLVEGWNWCAIPAPDRDDLWYAYSAGNRKMRLHQFLLGKPPPGHIIDHRDRNGLNCRRSNMRFVTRAQNSQNKRRPQIGGGKYKGVTQRGTRWRARIVINGKRTHLGYFPSEYDAAIAYDIAAKKYFGEHAFLNFPTQWDSMWAKPFDWDDWERKGGAR